METHGPSLRRAVPQAGGQQASSTPAGSAGAGLGRGLAAGLAGGLASGMFLLFAGEPSLDRAIRLEQAASAGHASEEVFTRSEQHLGMVLASGLYGLAIGGVLGVVLLVMSRRMSGTGWERSMKISLAGFGAYFVVPFLKYPASPPGTGDPERVAVLTTAYLVLVAASVGACILGVAMARRLAARGVERHKRHLIVGACYLLLVGTAFVALPSGVNPDGMPAGLLWEFRMASAGGQAILWIGTGAILGLLTMRAEGRGRRGGESRRVITDQEV